MIDLLCYLNFMFLGLEKQLLDGYDIGKKNLPGSNVEGRPRSSSNVSRGPGIRCVIYFSIITLIIKEKLMYKNELYFNFIWHNLIHWYYKLEC